MTAMQASKKRKISGLELDMTLTQLRKLRSSVIVEGVPKSEPTPRQHHDDHHPHITS